MNQLYFLFWKYEPCTALFNRRWSLAKGIADSGIPVKAIFMLPNNGCICETNYPNIECIYLGEKSKHKNKALILFSSTMWVIRNMKKGDSLISITNLFVPLLVRLFLGKDRLLYTEYSEYPPLMYKNNLIGRLGLKYFLSNTRKQDGVFVISKSIKDYLVGNGVMPKKVHIINMTVDRNRFNNIEKQQTEPYICYCGTVSNFKDGVDVLLEAFGIIAKDIPNIKLYILGPRPFVADNEKNDAIIDKYGIRDRVYIPGAVPGSEMPQYLKNAEVLVLSRPDNIQAAYGFPTKLGEYLMTGNPVVVTRVGELDNFLEDGKSCLFAKPGDAQHFAKKLKWTLENPAEAKEIGAKGKQVAEVSFNYKIEGKKIAEVITRDSNNL